MAGENVGTIAQAYVQIMPSTQGMQGQLTQLMGGEASSAGQSAGKNWSGGFTKALVAGGVAVAAGVGMAKSLYNSVAETAAYGDNIDKMSQKLGMTAEAYQEWDAILQHSGTSIDAMQSSMKTLAAAAESGNEAFSVLGITQEELGELNQQQLFERTISALQTVESDTQRTYLAGKLLGRGATELGALLNTSAEETEAMRQRVHELGGVMSDEAVKNAAAFQDSLQDMQTAFSGLSRGVLAEFMPEITGVMNGLTEIFSGDSDKGIGMIVDGIAGLAGKLVDHAPEIAEAGVQLVVALAAALIQSTPRLVMAIPQIILAIGRGLLNGTREIREAGRQLIDSAKQAFMEKVGEAGQWGSDLIQNFINGLLSRFSALRETVRGAAQTVKNFLGFSEPSEGPLSDFHTYSPDMMELWNQGIRDSESAMRAQLRQSFTLRPIIQQAAEAGGTAPAPIAGNGGRTMPRKLEIPLYIGRDEFARLIVDLYDTEKARVGLKLTGGAPA